MGLAPQVGHGEPDETLVNFGDSLHIGGQDLGVLREVDEEGVARPAALHLHHLEWGASQ